MYVAEMGEGFLFCHHHGDTDLFRTASSIKRFFPLHYSVIAIK